MRQVWQLFAVIIIVLSFANQAIAENGELLTRAGKDHYIIAISRRVFEQNPEVIERLNSTLFLEDNSVKNFFLKNSYNQFDFGATAFVVGQDYPTMFSVTADLDDFIDWAKIRGVLMINVNDCGYMSAGDALLPQEFQTNDGRVLLTGVILSKCTALGDSGNLKQAIAHELTHTFNMFGHANLLDSSVYFTQKKYQGCRLPFNSRSPDVKNFNAKDNCPVIEYGDPFDILGTISTGLSSNVLSASRKELIGWLPTTLPTTRVIKNKGNYNMSLYSHDTTQPNNRSLLHVKIMKGRYGFYSIEFRENVDVFLGSNKVLIRYAFKEGGITYLIASLSPGETYRNSVDKFSVKFKSRHSSRKAKAARLKIILK